MTIDSETVPVGEIAELLGRTNVFGLVFLDTKGVIVGTQGQLVDWIAVGANAADALPFLVGYEDDLIRANGGDPFQMHLPNLRLATDGADDRIYSVFVCPSSGGAGATLLFQDTTEFSELERTAMQHRNELFLARRELERQYTLVRSIMDNALDAILTVDGQDVIKTFNPAAEIIFSRPASEAVNTPLKDLIPDVDHPQHLKDIGKPILNDRGEEVGLNCEVEGLRQSGTPFPLDLVISHMVVDDERLTLAIGRDITERKKAERNLERAKQVAERATELKDKVMSLVAHDLRTPLASVIQFFGLLKGTDSRLSGELNELIDSEESNCWSAINLIEQVLNVNRLRSGQIDPVMEVVGPAELVDLVIGKVAQSAGAKTVEIVNALPKDFVLRVDPTLFMEVIQNLLSNAIKFSAPGQTVRVSSPDVRKGIISVEDTGTGIEAKRLTTLFTLGENESTRGTSGERGTGFGLPLSRDMLRTMGGDLTVKSVVGEGSTFSIRLPDSVV